MDFEYPEEPPESGYHIVRKWVDGSGVNVRWMDKFGDVHESNFAHELDANDKWKSHMDEKVAQFYAQHELAKAERKSQSDEMDMQVNKISDSDWANKNVDIGDKVEKKKKQVQNRMEKMRQKEERKKQKKNTKPGQTPSEAIPNGAKNQ